MKIQSIRIQNLASLDGNTEIDFSEEPLYSAGIFAITGPTGAGKSTVLDALCLALYAKTPRYRLAENGIDILDVQGSTIKQDDVRGILRDGTSNGYAEVDFIGIDDQYYRARWSVRRARNKAEGNLQAYEMSLKNLSSNQDIPGRKTELLTEIERLVGLNFEQFTRSVLLAQGDFTAFLKAGKDEKSSLLEKLTGTHIYSEISKKIFEHHREEQQQLRELNLQREGIATLTSEELHVLQEQKKELKSSIETDEKQITDLNKELDWHEQLKRLQESVESANELHNQAIIAKTEAKPREYQFQQITRVQPARSIITGLQNVQEQITSRSKEAEGLSTTINGLKEQKKSSDAAFQQATETLNKRIQEEQQAQPLLNMAKALDVQLGEKAEQIKQATEDVTSVCKKEAQQKDQYSDTKKELEVIEEGIVKLNQWKDDHKNYQSIAEQEHLILSKLNDSESILKSLQDYNTRLHNTKENIAKKRQEKQALLEQQHIIQNSLKQKQGEYESLNSALSDISIQDVEKEKISLDTSIEDLIAATAHWKLLFQAILEKNKLQQSLKENREALEQSSVQLSETQKLLESTTSEKATSLKMLEKAKLAAAESVDQLRNQLEPNEPCPVCGSTEHPYATHHPGLDKVLLELETEHAKIEANYTQQFTLYTALNQNCQELTKKIGEQEDQTLQNNTSLNELQTTWLEFQIATKCNEYPFEERTAWLQQQLQQQKIRQQQLQEHIQAYKRQKEQLEAHKAQLTSLEKELNNNENQVKDTERLLKSLEEQQKNDSIEQQNQDKKLEEIRQALVVYFSSEQWFENWQANPSDFVAGIKKFAGEWKTNITRLEEYAHKQTILTEKRNGLEEQLTNIHKEVQANEQKLSKIQIQNKELSDKRMALFAGAPVAETETRLKEAIDFAKQTLENQRITAEKIQGDLTRNSAQHEQLEKDISSLSKQKAGQKGQLTNWVTNYNQQYETELTLDELAALLTFSQDWIETERNSLRAIDDKVMQIKSILEERTKTLATHSGQRLSERTLEELVTLRGATQELLKQHTQQANEIDFKIKEDTLNKQRIGTFLQNIEKQAAIVENWAKLNEIIGSADGKKFRQIAQEYTLDVLLSYANVHLEVLSKRYVLQRIPNSLGLQVIDQDMGDEVRTVYSLSGGESFLVSMALALGLASLSSSRMKVESLFIDEGFGSLDPATLNIAMDALERLHNQGRKVGVISHVQEMTERIPVQIKVSKQQSGKSTVEVIGY